MNAASNPERRKLTNGDSLSVSGMTALFSQWLSDMERFIDERDRRYEERATAETKRIDGSMLAEQKRIDALLTANAASVSLASNRAELTATTLAERVDISAKTLAAQVEATARTLAAQVEATAKGLAARIEPLEAARYTQAGRSGISSQLLMLLAGLGGGILVFAVQQLAMR